MNKGILIAIIVAIVMVISGSLIFFGVVKFSDRGFEILSSDNIKTSSYELKGNLKDINIDTNEADISFFPSEDGQIKIVCSEDENLRHKVTMNGGSLDITVEAEGRFKWIQLGVGKQSIDIYIPDGEYGSLTIDSDTGDVTVPGEFSFETIGISTDTGSIECKATCKGSLYTESDTGAIALSGLSANFISAKSDTGRIEISSAAVGDCVYCENDTGRCSISDTKCRVLMIKEDTGNVLLTDVLADERFDITSSTGGVTFDGCDAGEIYAKTSTGNVSGTLLSDKVYLIESDTGRINVPKTITGGRCEIETDTGNVEIKVL